VTIVTAGVFLTIAVVMGRFYKPQAPTGAYDVTPPAQQEPAASPSQVPPAGPNQAPPAADAGKTAGDANTSADTNLPGS
jgi:hypothetical protein